MPQLTRTQVLADIAATINDNSAADITAQEVRDILTDIVDSASWYNDPATGATDLDYSPATREILSSTGQSAALPLATALAAGLMSTADKNIFDGHIVSPTATETANGTVALDLSGNAAVFDYTATGPATFTMGTAPSRISTIIRIACNGHQITMPSGANIEWHGGATANPNPAAGNVAIYQVIEIDGLTYWAKVYETSPVATPGALTNISTGTISDTIVDPAAAYDQSNMRNIIRSLVARINAIEAAL